MLVICAYGPKNTGAGCFPEIGALLMDVLVPLRNKLGVENYMDMADVPFDEAYFVAKVNESDPSERWYPLPAYKNPSDVRGDSLTQTFDDNTSVIIEQGSRVAMAIISGKQASPTYLKQLKSFQALPDGFGKYSIDIFGNWIGYKKDGVTDKLYPIPMDADSFDPIWNPGNSKEKQNIKMKFVYHKSVKDTNISMVAAEELDYDVSYLKGLLNVTAVFSNLNNNPGTFTVELNTEYGTLLNTQRVSGLVAADFTLYNITGAVAIVITSVTEQTDSNGDGIGVYDFVIPNQTANDVIRLTPDKDGFDFSAVVANHPVLV